MSLEKTSYTLFHLNTHETSHRPKIGLGKSTISYWETPKYLGVTLDHSLTYKHDLFSLCQKIASRRTLLSKLAGTTWGTSPHTLHTSALALVNSTAEYCTPVWLLSAHTKLLDTSINSALCTIMGCLKPTLASHLPLLACIAPAYLRHDTATSKLAEKYSRPDHHLKHSTTKRLKFHCPFARAASDLMDFLKQEETTSSWIHRWWYEESKFPTLSLNSSRTVHKQHPPNLTCLAWVTLNRS